MTREEALGLIRKNRKTAKILSDSRQLKTHSDDVVEFITEAILSLGSLPPDLISYFEILSSVVRSTDQFPDDAEYLIRLPSGEKRLDGRGRLIPPSGTGAIVAADEAPVPKLALDGLDSIKEKPLSFFMEAYARKKLNKLAFAAFAGAPDYLSAAWSLPKLRTFYAEHGNVKWLPPIDDFVKIERLLERFPAEKKLKEITLKAMANAGRMGFCPTQYLRRVILPQLEKFKSEPAIFEEGVSLASDCFRFVCEQMGREGDGSASNLFTLKTLIRPLADPSSRLFVKSYYSDPSTPPMRDIFYTIGKAWAELFRKKHPYLREILRYYGDVFFERIVRIEVPKEILSRSLRMLAHVDFLCEEIQTDRLFRGFFKSQHTKGVRILLERAERTSHYAVFLRTLSLHFEVIEKFIVDARARRLKDPFGPEYRRYLRFFASGSFKHPDDIVEYFAISESVRGIRESDTDELLRIIMTYARDPEERIKTLDFLKNSPVFDKDIFLAWRTRSEAEREKLIGELVALYDTYLTSSDLRVRLASAPELSVQAENAVIRQYVVSSQLTKTKIDSILARNAVTGSDPVPDPLKKPWIRPVPERSRGEGAKDGDPGKPRNENYGFLASKHALVRKAEEDLQNPEARPGLVHELAESVFALASDFESRISALETETMEVKSSKETGKETQGRPAADKKRAGLLKQAERVKIVAAFLSSLDEEGYGSRDKAFDQEAERIVAEASLYSLVPDKAFGKAHAEDFALLVLESFINEGEVERMSEEPFGPVLALQSEPDRYSFEEVRALKEIFSSVARNAIVRFFLEEMSVLPPGLRTRIRALFADPDGREFLRDETAIAEFVYRKLAGLLALATFDKEISSLERRGAGDKTFRSVAFVAGKRRIDQFYGHVGELCISDRVDEIKRRDFIPVRILDNDNKKLVGYLLLFLFDGLLGETRERLLLVGGIEPKSSWMAYLLEDDFYRVVKEYLVSAAKDLEAAAVCITCNWVAHSNCSSIVPLIKADIQDKPIVSPVHELIFPKNSWNLSPMTVIWTARPMSFGRKFR